MAKVDHLKPWSADYRKAVEELLFCISFALEMSDSSLEVLVEAQAEPENRKRLVMGLKMLDLINDEQAAFAIAYRWPLRGA